MDAIRLYNMLNARVNIAIVQLGVSGVLEGSRGSKRIGLRQSVASEMQMQMLIPWIDRGPGNDRCLCWVAVAIRQIQRSIAPPQHHSTSELNHRTTETSRRSRMLHQSSQFEFYRRQQFAVTCELPEKPLQIAGSDSACKTANSKQQTRIRINNHKK